MGQPLPRPTRRQVMGTIGAGAAAAWAAPSILSVDAARASTVPPLDLTAVAGHNQDFVLTASDGRVFRSLDAGLNWVANAAPPPPPGTDLVVAASAGSQNEFVVATAAGQVWYTINAGLTWASPTTGPLFGASVVAAAGVDDVFVLISSDGAVWWSDTNGDVWNEAATPPAVLVTPAPPIVALGAGAGVFIALTSDGQVFGSPGGNAWTVEPVPAGGPVTFTSVACNGLDTCAVAGTSIVYRCQIEGTWSSVDTGFPDLVVVAADGLGDFVAVSSTGTVIRSIDGTGSSWALATTPPTFTMTHVSGDHTGDFVGFGSDGKVARTVDFGDNWQAPISGPG